MCKIRMEDALQSTEVEKNNFLVHIKELKNNIRHYQNTNESLNVQNRDLLSQIVSLQSQFNDLR